MTSIPDAVNPPLETDESQRVGQKPGGGTVLAFYTIWAKGPAKNTFAFLGVEAPGWQGTRREHTGSIRPTSDAARRDGSAARNVKIFLTGP